MGFEITLGNQPLEHLDLTWDLDPSDLHKRVDFISRSDVEFQSHPKIRWLTTKPFENQIYTICKYIIPSMFIDKYTGWWFEPL